MKRIWLWVCGGLVALVAAGGGLYFTMSAKGAPSADKIKITEVSQQEKDRIALQMVSQSGFAAKAGEIRYTKLEPTPSGWSVVIDAFGHEKDLPAINKAAQQLFYHLHHTGVRLADVDVVFRSNAFRDDYGHQLSNLAVATMRFSGQKLKSIKWDDVEPARLPIIADAFWKHPLLSTKPQSK